MTSFAPGTNPEYAAAYNNWWFNGGQQRGEPAPNRQAFGPGSGEGQRFRPGMAQPIAPPSRGTPYGQWSPSSPVPSAAGGDMASWGSRGEAQAALGGRPVAQFGPGSWGATDGERQAPFTQTLNTPFGQMDPSQYYQRRDAFIQSAHNQMGQYNPGGQMAGQAPQWNPQQMWGQAGQMVQRGWQNPMAQPGGQQRPGLVDIDSPMYGSGGAFSGPAGNQSSRQSPFGEGARRAQSEQRPSGGDTGWRQQHQSQIAGQANQNWLRSLTPANRQAYGMMQRMF